MESTYIFCTYNFSILNFERLPKFSEQDRIVEIGHSFHDKIPNMAASVSRGQISALKNGNANLEPIFQVSYSFPVGFHCKLYTVNKFSAHIKIRSFP